MIHGPTGFGKSTLAAQWAKVLTAEGVAVAWLTVDHDDNNVVWFLVASDRGDPRGDARAGDRAG